MLKLRAAPLILLAFISCTSTYSPANDPVQMHSRPSFAPVYFIDGLALLPYFVEVAEGDPVEQLFAALTHAPQGTPWRTAVPADAEVRGEFERGEVLHLDLGGAFWEGDPHQVLERTAQVVYTMSSLEEGRRIRLLFLGAPPGRLRSLFEEPIDRSYFDDRFPVSIQVLQPAAGSLISTRFPVRVALRGIDEARVFVRNAATKVVLATADLTDGDALIRLSPDSPEELNVVIEGSNRNHDHRFHYGVTFIAP